MSSVVRARMGIAGKCSNDVNHVFAATRRTGPASLLGRQLLRFLAIDPVERLTRGR